MGWLRSGERPSMEAIFLPATAEMGVTQDRTGWPSMWTVQAPNNDMPHPNLVPVMPSVSRKTQSSGMAETASTDCGLPFKVNLTAGTAYPPLVHSLEKVYAKGEAVADKAVRGSGCGARVGGGVWRGLSSACW